MSLKLFVDTVLKIDLGKSKSEFKSESRSELEIILCEYGSRTSRTRGERLTNLLLSKHQTQNIMA